MWLYGVAVTSMLFVFVRQHSFQHIQRTANNLRSALTILIYRKLMRMSKSSFQDTTDIGKMLNVLANDLQRLDEAGQDLIFMFCAPLMSIYVIIISCHMIIGVSCAGGLLALLFFIPFQTVMERPLISLTSLETFILLTSFEILRIVFWRSQDMELANVIEKLIIRWTRRLV